MTSPGDISEILGRHLSAMNAESLLKRALRDSGVAGEHLTHADVHAVLKRLERGIRLFLTPTEQNRLWDDLAALGGPRQPDAHWVIAIELESHISDARLRARALCEEQAAKSTVVQKVATIVSELSRNIVSYTPGGTVAMSVVSGLSRRVRIVATDRGKGIPMLDDVMAGRYRSKTGLGKGILGVKRLSDDFEIQSGPTGTRICAEVDL